MTYIAKIRTQLITCFFCTVAVSAGLGGESFAANAQEQSLYTFNFFLDGYNSQDSDLDGRRAYSTQGSVSDEPRINLGYIDFTTRSTSRRGRLAFQAGDAVRENYRTESHNFWQYIQEAYTGWKVADKLWIDTGIFLSSLAPEAWVSQKNWTYTRSLISDFSPSYQLGVRASYEISPDLKAEASLIRGWQNISSNSKPALSTSLTWSPHDDLSLKHSLFVGYEDSGIRTFNSLGTNYSLTDSWRASATYILGTQDQSQVAIWHGLSAVTQVDLTSMAALSLRAEHFSDPNQSVARTLSGDSFGATGVSSNIDFKLGTQIMLRNEYRMLFASHKIFPTNGGEFHGTDHVFLTSLSLKL